VNAIPIAEIAAGLVLLGIGISLLAIVRRISKEDEHLDQRARLAALAAAETNPGRRAAWRTILNRPTEDES
jgi:hypothetical protein